MAKRILIRTIQHTYDFSTKKEAEDYIRGIRDSMEDDVPILGEPYEFLLGLLERHPNAKEKIGCGVEYFTVRSDGWKNRCFYLHRTDRSEDNFSFYKSLDAKYNIWSLVNGALSHAVNQQIWEFRDSQLPLRPVCPYTGEEITADNYHVDHYCPTFLELTWAWMDQNGLTVEDIKISDGTDEIGRSMVEPGQRTSWQEFHRTNKHLRMLSRRGNLSQAKKESNKRIKLSGAWKPEA